jgi:hypothetical protein
MLAEWFARRALDKRFDAHIERTYREIVDELAGGECDPEELETQLADAVAGRSALVLTTYVFVGALRVGCTPHNSADAGSHIRIDVRGK